MLFRSVLAMKQMTGEDWESPVIPDERVEELIQESFLDNYESIG